MNDLIKIIEVFETGSMFIDFNREINNPKDIIYLNDNLDKAYNLYLKSKKHFILNYETGDKE